MKWIWFLSIAALLGTASLSAQTDRAASPGMTAGPPGPGLSGSTAKLFGTNTSFSAQLEMQTVAGQGLDSMSIPGKISFDEGKSRFEMDMTEIKGGMMTPQAAAAMRSVGMDKTIVISRPDKQIAYQIYPGMQAYIETKLGEKEAATPASDFKLDLAELGKEKIDGHPCVKNRATVTEKDGTRHDALVWNATDLRDFPVRIEQTEGTTMTTLVFKDIRFAKPAAEVFQLPSNVTRYETLQTMMQTVLMKQMGGAVTHSEGGQ